MALAGRCVVRGKIIETEELPAYCAVAMAGLNDLPDTIMTRSVAIRMRRRAPTETVQPWRYRINAPEGEQLRERLTGWVAAVKYQGRDWPEIPAEVQDRDADVWEPLLTVAELAGGHWPETARVAAVAAVAASREANPLSLGVLLLRDIRTVFSKLGDVAAVAAEICTQLRGIEEGPWETIKRDGKPIDPASLAKRLRRYGITSTDIRFPTADGSKVLKGYYRKDFVDSWVRYLPDDDNPVGPPPEEAATAATAATSQVNDGALFGEPSPNGEVRYCRCGNTLDSPESKRSGRCKPCRDKHFAGYE